MTHGQSSALHAFHHPSAKTLSSVENMGPDVDQHLAGLLDSFPEALVCLDRQWRVTYINAQAERLLQQPYAALLGKTLWEVLPEAIGSTFYQQSYADEETPTAFHFEDFSPRLNKWLQVHISPS